MNIRWAAGAALLVLAGCGATRVGVGPTPSPSPPAPTASVSPSPSRSAPPPPSPSPTPRPIPSPSPSSAQGGATCTATDLATTVATDRASYHPGQAVTVTVAVRNTSGRSCRIDRPYPETFGTTVRITTPSGALVWAPGPVATGVMVQPSPLPLAPGGSYLWTTVLWDQHVCNGSCANPGPHTEGGLVTAGTYAALPNVDPPSPALPATFTILAQ